MGSSTSPSRRLLPWVFAAGGFGVFVGAQIVLAMSKASSLGSAAVPFTLAVVGVVLGGGAAAMALSVHRQRVRLAILRRRYPLSLVFPAIHPQRLTDTLRWLGYTGPRLGNYFVVRVDEEGVEFWKGGGEPVRRFLLPASQISTVRPGVGVVSRPIGVIDFVADDANGEAVLIQVSPSCEGWRLPFSRLSAASIEQTALAIRDRVRLSSERPG